MFVRRIVRIVSWGFNKSVAYLQTSNNGTYKSNGIELKKQADKQLMIRTNSCEYVLEESRAFLKLLNGINTDSSLIKVAKSILQSSSIRNESIKGILRQLMELGETPNNPGQFRKEFERLREKLAKKLYSATGRSINLGYGLCDNHSLFVMMNYATPACKSWKGSRWNYNRMNPSQGCISFWLQSVITCLERRAGVEKQDDRDVGCISLQDRLFWVCNTNTPLYIEEIPIECNKARISEDVMHLIPMVLLELKVKYAKMNGHPPSILTTGAETRDKLFKKDSTVITPDALFG